MAEPVSIVASAVTVTGAAITVADAVITFVSQLRNAPKEIAFLQADVIDTRLILSNIKDNTAEDRSLGSRLALPDSAGTYGSPENISKLDYSVKRIERVLVDIDSALRHVTKSQGLSRTTVHQGQWIIHRTKLKSLRQELQELKTNVAVHFSANSRVLLENAQTVQQQTERSDQFHLTLQALVRQVDGLGRMPAVQRQLLGLAENMSTAVVSLEERSRLTTTTITSTDQMAPSLSAISNRSEALPGQPPNYSVNTTSSTTVSTDSVSKLKLEFSRFQKRGCVPECECTCHRRKKYRSPSIAQKILGEIFIAFSGLSLRSMSCADNRCIQKSHIQKSQFSATVTYYLPTLFLRKMISLVLITTSQGDPAACLKVRPISSDFSIYRAVEGNDLQAVQKMISNQQSHASATFKGGWTPLHYAINYGHTAICKSLLAIGADPLIEDGWNLTSPLEWAWIKILGRAYEHETQQEMEQMFNDSECLKEMCFTTLHRIVLGLNSSSLEDHILQNPDSINTTDAYGRTALSWAAQRGSVETVKSLLLLGADPNLCTPRGHSPLMYAAESRNPDCLQPLLNNGADVNQCDVEGQTPLHYAAGHRSDLAYYRPLIEANANPNWPTIPRMTPLTTVILEGHNDAMRYLVGKGADSNLMGHDDRSPTFFAVEYNNLDALEYLFEIGANFTGSSLSYPSIAHVAAHHAKVRTLRALTAFRLPLRDVDCVDNEGLAIPQIVEKRLQTDPHFEDGFAQAFGLFLKSIRTEELAASLVEVEEDEEFHDAPEEIFT